MKQIMLILVVFVSGMLLSYALWAPTKNIDSIYQAVPPIGQSDFEFQADSKSKPNFEFKQDSGDSAARELRAIASGIHQRLDKLEKTLEQSSTTSQSGANETQDSADPIVSGVVTSAYGKTIAVEQNESTMSKAVNYVYSQIDAGSWSQENAQYIQSIADQLTKEQLIDIQLSLNEAINKDQMTINFDLAVHPIF